MGVIVLCSSRNVEKSYKALFHKRIVLFLTFVKLQSCSIGPIRHPEVSITPSAPASDRISEAFNRKFTKSLEPERLSTHSQTRGFFPQSGKSPQRGGRSSTPLTPPGSRATAFKATKISQQSTQISNISSYVTKSSEQDLQTWFGELFDNCKTDDDMSLEKMLDPSIAVISGSETPTGSTPMILGDVLEDPKVFNLVPKGKKVIQKTNLCPDFDLWNFDQLPNGTAQFELTNPGNPLEIPEGSLEIPVVVKDEIPTNANIIMSSSSNESDPANIWSGNSLFNDDSLAMIDPRIAEGHETSAKNSPIHENNEPDLFKMVLDSTIDPDSQEFQDFVKVDAQNDDLLTLDPTALSNEPSTSLAVKTEPEEYQPPVKRGRGRPRLPKGPEPPRRPRGRPPTAPSIADVPELDDSSNMSEDELKDLKYRRMRDLNNAASKRCRVNRKRKFDDMETEVILLKSRNLELTNTVEDLEKKVETMKKAIFNMIANKKKSQEASTADESAVATADVTADAAAVSLFDLDLF